MADYYEMPTKAKNFKDLILTSLAKRSQQPDQLQVLDQLIHRQEQEAKKPSCFKRGEQLREELIDMEKVFSLVKTS